MKNDNEFVIINGKKAKILFNKSHSFKFTIEKSNVQTIEVIDALLRGADSSFKYQDGITTMQTLTTLDGFTMGNTRISNHIGVLRFYLDTNSLYTYKVLGEKLPRYAVAKNEKSINALEELKEKILQKLGKNHSNNLPTKTADR